MNPKLFSQLIPKMFGNAIPKIFIAFLFVITLASTAALAQKNEIAVLLGGTYNSGRNVSLACPVGTGVICQSPNQISFSKNLSVEGSYAHQFFSAGVFSLGLELPVVAAPNVSVTSNDPAFTARNYSALFVTPGIRLQTLSVLGLAPWVSVGGGWAHFGESTTNLNGVASGLRTGTNTAAVQFGGGVDLRLVRNLALRGEVRDFYAGVPNLTANSTGRSHNIMYAGGIVLRF